MPRKYLREGETGSQPKARGSHFMRNIFLLAIVFAAAAGVYSLLPKGAPISLPVPSAAPNAPITGAATRAFEKNYEDYMLSYNDPDYGYEINYPIGYDVQTSPDVGIALRVSARITEDYSELFDVFITKEASSLEIFDSNKENLKADGFVDFEKQDAQIGGRTVRLLYGRMKNPGLPGEFLLARMAVYDCQTPDGTPYVAAVSAIIPPIVAQETDLADYMISSFKC